MGQVQRVENNEVAMTTQSDGGALITAISRAASDPNTDIDKMERLMAMHERITAKNAEQAFNAAMSAAQRDMGRVSADATNPQTRSKYATYAALDRALRPVYTQHGFSLSFDTGEAASEWVRVVCYVSHVEGHSRTYHADMPADGLGAKGNAVMTKTHAAGSAMSYGMRYLLKLIFNVAVGEDDDDGNGATAPKPKLSQEQIANIESLLTETKSDRGQFLAWIGGGMCASLSDVPASQYAAAIKGLEAKRRRG